MWARCPAALPFPVCVFRSHYSCAGSRLLTWVMPVAVVVATDKYIARDAADPIEVEYDRAAAVSDDPERAMRTCDPLVHPESAGQHGVHVTTRKAATSTRLLPKPMLS